jgi:parallel beta-helix repeat protein
MSRILLVLMPVMMICLLGATVYTVPGSFGSIQAALDVCVSGDTVRVAPGVYYESLVWPSVDGISLIGNEQRENTIIDAGGLDRVLTFAPDLQAGNVTADTYVKNFTFQRGYSTQPGAGVYCYYASPTIENCFISFNTTTDDPTGSGGGLYCYNSSPHLINVVIAYNTAYSGGGAHIDALSSPVFENCVIADNGLNFPGGSFAAGIYGRYEAYFTLDRCTIARNRGYDNAAIHLGEVSNPTITHCTITDNHTGIRMTSNSGVELHDSNIIDNSEAGVYNISSNNAFVTSNYWGSSTGPEYINNPGGTGDHIFGPANFNPWLSTYDMLSPLVPPVDLQAAMVGDHTIQLSWVDTQLPPTYQYEINYGLDSLLVIQPFTQYSLTNDTILAGLISNRDYYIQVCVQVFEGDKSWYSQRVKVRTSGVSNDDPASVPAAPLLVCGPNPFREKLSIQYEAKGSGLLELSVYDIRGRLVRSLVSSDHTAGMFQSVWNGCDAAGRQVPTGVYILRLRQGRLTANGKLTLIR